MRIAIIVPTCNRPPVLLNRAVASVYAQSRPIDHLVIVNDGHCDVQVEGATVVKTRGWEGLAAARKAGTGKAIELGAEVIGYVDDDDELLPNHVDLLARQIESGSPFAFSRAVFRYADGLETEDPEPGNHDPNKSYYDPTALLRQNVAPVSSYMHSAAAYEAAGGWDPRVMRMEDWDLWGRIFLGNGPPAYVPVVTNVIHRGHGPNLTTSSPLGYSMCCSWRDFVADRLERISRGETEDWGVHGIPRVGVVMPVHNAGKYLGESLGSLMLQTFQDFEILAVNDGSTDGSRKMLEECPRVRVFDLPANMGVARALNLGLLVSRSEYLARMDADDVCVPQRLERQVEFLDKNRGVGIVGSRFLSMDEDLASTIWDNRDIPLSPDDVAGEMRSRCCVGHPTVMMRRRVVEVIGGYSEAPETRHVEDYDLWLRAIRKGFKIANMPDSLLMHRVHNEQMSSKHVSSQQDNLRRVQSMSL